MVIWLYMMLYVSLILYGGILHCGRKKVIMPKTEISTSMSAWFWLRAVLLVWSANMRKTQVTEPRSRAKDGHLNKENTVELVENSGGLT